MKGYWIRDKIKLKILTKRLRIRVNQVYETAKKVPILKSMVLLTDLSNQRYFNSDKRII